MKKTIFVLLLVFGVFANGMPALSSEISTIENEDSITMDDVKDEDEFDKDQTVKLLSKFGIPDHIIKNVMGRKRKFSGSFIKKAVDDNSVPF